MKCDLCKHHEVEAEGNLLCPSCAEMIERLLTANESMKASQSSYRPAPVTAPPPREPASVWPWE